MWVRNQDKNGLFNVNFFEIEKKNVLGTMEEFELVFDDDEELEQKIEEILTDDVFYESEVKYENKVRVKFGKENRKTYYNITSSAGILGTYSTKEKALKVLDEIQEAITGKTQTYWTLAGVKIIEHYSNGESVVFQMPQEAEDQL